MSLFRREPLHAKLARTGGLLQREAEDMRPPWDKAGIHGGSRPREWDEVAAASVDVPGDRAEFVVLPDAIVIEQGPDNVELLADALSLQPPYRAEATRQAEGVWAVAARRIEVFAYRLLFVCALIGLANSNPTLRQMFDAIR